LVLRLAAGTCRVLGSRCQGTRARERRALAKEESHNAVRFYHSTTGTATRAGPHVVNLTTPLGALVPAATLKSVGRFYSRAELLEQRQRWKREGKTVVFTNGCYDLLHPAHTASGAGPLARGRSRFGIELRCQYAARQGAGPAAHRRTERAELALALEAVDAVTLFDRGYAARVDCVGFAGCARQGRGLVALYRGPGRSGGRRRQGAYRGSGARVFYY